MSPIIFLWIWRPDRRKYTQLCKRTFFCLFVLMLVRYHSIHCHRYYVKAGGFPSLFNQFMCCHNKIPPWAAEIADMYFSQFWELEIQDEGTRRYSSWSGLSSWCADGHLLVVSSHGFPQCVNMKRERSYKDTNPIMRAIWWPPLYLIPSQRPQLQEHSNFGGGTNIQLAQMVKNLSSMQETQVWFLDGEDLLEKGMATHSSILAWRIPWTEEPGRLQSIGSQGVGHNWMAFTYNHLIHYITQNVGPK